MHSISDDVDINDKHVIKKLSMHIQLYVVRKKHPKYIYSIDSCKNEHKVDGTLAFGKKLQTLAYDRIFD